MPAARRCRHGAGVAMRKLLALLWLAVWLTVAPPAAAQDGGHVYIPRLSLSGELVTVPIVGRAWDTSRLGAGIGWMDHTNWIDDGWGRVVIGAHSYGAFRDLDSIQVGDMVVLWDGESVVRYEVVSTQIVQVSEIDWVMPTTAPTLALITCAGAQRRVIVARQLD